MKIAVDMDNTLVDEFGKQLRPGVLDLLTGLQAAGHTLILWTSSTRQRAETILTSHGLKRHFREFKFREDYDPDNRGAVKDLRTFGCDAIIDDDPKHVDFANSIGLKGVLVASYRGGPAKDPDELKRVLAAFKPERGGLFGWLKR